MRDRNTVTLWISIISIAIAFLSFLAAIFSVGWQIYKEIRLKARLRILFRVMTLAAPALPTLDRTTHLSLSVTNLGPGKIKLKNPLSLKIKGFLKKTRYGIMLPAYSFDMSDKLPCELEVGDQIDICLQFNKECFLKEAYTHIGIQDSFGRIHWTKRKQFKEVKKTYKKWFKENEGK